MNTPIVATRSIAPPVLQTNTPGRQPAVFIDCDGVLVDEWIDSADEVDRKLRPDSVAALAKLTQQLPEARVALVSNKRWVGNDEARLQKAEQLFQAVAEKVQAAGGQLDAIHFAPTRGRFLEQPDHVSGQKPDQGMLWHIASEMGDSVDLADSYIIGDMTTDLEAGQKAHPELHKILVETGRGGRDGKSSVQPDRRCANLAEAVNWVIARETVAQLFE